MEITTPTQQQGGSGDEEWFSNTDDTMDKGTTTLVTVIIVGGIVMAAGILAFGMCKRESYVALFYVLFWQERPVCMPVERSETTRSLFYFAK
jgi:hypothetical protein